MTSRIWRRKKVDRKVKAMETQSAMVQAIVTERLTLWKSLAPKAWAKGIVNPAVSPCAKPRIRNMTLDEAEIPARASRPMVRPTIKVSTIL